MFSLQTPLNGKISPAHGRNSLKATEYHMWQMWFGKSQKNGCHWYELESRFFELVQVSDNLVFVLLGPLSKSFQKKKNCIARPLIQVAFLFVDLSEVIWHLYVDGLTWLYFFKEIWFTFPDWELCDLWCWIVSSDFYSLCDFVIAYQHIQFSFRLFKKSLWRPGCGGAVIKLIPPL